MILGQFQAKTSNISATLGHTVPSLVAAGLVFEAKVTWSLGSGLERNMSVTGVTFEVILDVNEDPSQEREIWCFDEDGRFWATRAGLSSVTTTLLQTFWI